LIPFKPARRIGNFENQFLILNIPYISSAIDYYTNQQELLPVQHLFFYFPMQSGGFNKQVTACGEPLR
jgi:hypothetical protein